MWDSRYTAQNAVHGCMAGFTGFTNGLVCGKNCLIPLEEMLNGTYSKKIPKGHRLWTRFLLSSGQPNFINNADEEVEFAKSEESSEEQEK